MDSNSPLSFSRNALSVSSNSRSAAAAVAPHQVKQLFTQARIVDMHARHIYGNGRGREAAVNPAAQGDAGLLPDVLVQPVDEAVLLEQRMKRSGGISPSVGCIHRTSSVRR